MNLSHYFSAPDLHKAILADVPGADLLLGQILEPSAMKIKGLDALDRARLLAGKRTEGATGYAQDAATVAPAPRNLNRKRALVPGRSLGELEEREAQPTERSGCSLSS